MSVIKPTGFNSVFSPIFSPIFGEAAGFSPASLFSSGEYGAWYEPGPSTCFTDAGVTPAGVGDAVYQINDLSGNGNHAVQTSLSARPILRQSVGGNYYLEFDGADDRMLFTNPSTGSKNHSLCYGGFASASKSIVALGFAGTPYADRSFSSEIAIRITGGAEVYDDSNTTSSAVVSHILDGSLVADNAAYKNGVELGVSALSPGTTLNSASTAYLGYAGLGYGDANLFGIVALDRAISEVERNQLEAYIAKISDVAPW